MHLDLAVLLQVLCNVQQDQSTLLDVLRVVYVDTHEEFEHVGLLEELNCAPFAELKVVHADVRAHLDRLRLLVRAFDLAT